MVRAASLLLKTAGAVAAALFLLGYLGGYTTSFAGERLALIPLLAGLGAAILDAYRCRKILGKTAVISLALLAGWAVFLRFPF